MLSSKPRSIASVTEYYYVGETPPSIEYGDANNNSVTGTGNWDTTSPGYLNSGEKLWNCEIIKYTTTDEEGKNLYQINPPQQVGYVGQDGKGIAEVINYYQATNTDTAPGYDNGNWKTNITDTGHGNDKPYLWNYEEIQYTTGDPTKT